MKYHWIKKLSNLWMLTLTTSLYLNARNPQEFPIDLVPKEYRAQITSFIDQCDFQFQTSTAPRKVKIATMEILFEHPRLSAAMWRYCQFIPSFFAFEEDNRTFVINDTKGLTGRLTLLYSAPGHRIYWVQGKAESGRLKPFSPAISAQMITSYRYWETENGFETQLDTWTKLDNAFLGFLAQPFRKYIQGRQDEFIAYINSNIVLFGESTEQNSSEFRDSSLILADLRIQRDFKKIYSKIP